jgi:hypothetical protein
MTRFQRNTRPRGRPRKNAGGKGFNTLEEKEERAKGLVSLWLVRVTGVSKIILMAIIGLCWILLFLGVMKWIYGLWN